MNGTGQAAGLPKHMQILTSQFTEPICRQGVLPCGVEAEDLGRTLLRYSCAISTAWAQPFTSPQLPHHLCYRQRGTQRGELMKFGAHPLLNNVRGALTSLRTT